MSRLLQTIGVIAILVLVAGSLAALAFVGKGVHVTLADEEADAARGPDPVELLRADVAQLGTDMAGLAEGMGGGLQALNEALAEERSRGERLAAEVTALRKEAQQTNERLERVLAEYAAARELLEWKQTDEAAAAEGAASASAPATPSPETAVASTQAAPAPEPPPTEQDPAAVAPGAEASAPAPEKKAFLAFKLPSQSFAFDELQRWALVPGLSRVGFDAKSTLHDFSGATQKVEGELVANLRRPEVGCKGKIMVDAASLDSGEPARDADMREQLGVSEHGKLTFEWSAFTDTVAEEKTMRTTGIARGKLTIHGMTRDVAMPVRVSVDASKRAVIEGELALKMSDFGVEPPSKLGMISVEDEVKIWIALRARSLGAASAGQ